MNEQQKEKLINNLLSFIDRVTNDACAAKDSELEALPKVAQALAEICKYC